jgi:hypothetical protein
MAKKEFSTSIGKIGMNRDGHISALRQEEYRLARNTNVVEGFLQSEHSNILTAKRPGYKVIGLKNHNNKDITYFFLTNPTTGYSEIASISNLQYIENEDDIQMDCGDCNIKNVLSEPLEDTVQTPTHTFTTLIEDSCNGCLNFSIDHPIHFIVIKEEVTGTRIYWTDNYNVQRYLDLNRLDEYKYTGDIVCGEDHTEETCLDCDKLRMFAQSEHMVIEPDTLQSGGNLRRAVYEFAGAYCNKEGVELTEYHSFTQPIHIFDKENNVLSQTELSERTSYAIKLNVSNLDKDFRYYKVVVTMTTDQATQYFVEGIHGTTDGTVIFTTEDNKQRFDITTLNQVFPVYRKAGIFTESNNKLYQANVQQEVDWNLQPVVNFMGTFAKWLTVEASEKLYENGVLSAKYKSRMRDEVYPHGIRFKTSDRYTTPVYPLISRPPTTDELEEVDNDETQSVLRNNIGCEATERTKRWQFYNTATNEGILDSYDGSGIQAYRQSTKYCIQENIGQIPGAGELLIINLEEFEEYIDLESFINDNYEYIYYYNGGDTTILLIQEYLNTTYPDCPDVDRLVELEGTSGTANINVEGVDYLVTFASDLTTTADNFVTTHAAALLIEGVTVTADVGILAFKGMYPTVITITTLTGDLDGEVSETLFPDTCEYPEKDGDPKLSINGVEGEVAMFIEKEIEEYIPSTPPEYCYVNEYGDDGQVIQDERIDLLIPNRWLDPTTTTETLFLGVRVSTEFQEKCNYAEEIVHKVDEDIVGQAYHLAIYGTLPETEPGEGDEIVLADLYDTSYTFTVSNSVTLTGTSGTANINVGGVDYLSTFNTSLTQTATDFVTDHAAALDALDITVTADGETLTFISSSSTITIINLTGDLNGTVVLGPSANGWYPGLHKGAIWFKGFVQPDEPRFVFDMTPLTKKPWYEVPQNGETFARRLDIVRQIQAVLKVESSLRVSIWDNCSSREPIRTYIFEKDDGIFQIFDTEDTLSPDYLPLTRKSFLVSVEAPIYNSVSFSGDIEPDIYMTVPPWDCFSIFTRPIEFSEVRVTFDSIGINKSQKYVATCMYEVPQPNDCAPQSFETGKFSYWESIETYPDNTQLYDSSGLIITPDDIPESIVDEFEETYTTGTAEIYTLKDSNFICQPIRHFKYPDSAVSPFISPIEMAPFTDSIVYPIGMTIDENIINSFLDIAVNNSLITQAQRDSIVGYEIMYGNRVGNKSIQAKGVAFDSMKYTEKGKDVEYSNFPFNDLGKNKYFKDNSDDPLEHPFNSEKNHKFMFMSPDIYSNIQLNPTEVNIEGYLFGDSTNTITEVKDHPKWVILGKDAKKTATKLAVIEGVIEVALGLTESMEVFRLDFGFVVSLNVAGIILYILRAIAVIANAFVKVGQYRLQWLKTIKDLGTPYNFASRNTGVGHYNYMLNEHQPEQRLRGISGIGKINSGINNITDKQGNISHINNIDREQSLYISFGYDDNDQPIHIEYPSEYINYDNNERNYSSSSRFTAGEENCPEGKSEEYIKNVASPYFSLKNYVPAQYGTIDSVVWLTTSYNGNLKSPNTTPRIFGGDVFISRFAEIRKIPFFLTTAMGQASLTPFDYEKYSNLGTRPTYYCDYEFGSDTNFGDILFPDLDSKYNFDCLRGQNGFYIKPPAKFYLYSHGIASYLVESEINCNNRYAKEGLLNSFYPQEQDYIRLTEQVDRPIRTPNTLFYNNAYSKNIESHPYTILPSTYDKDTYEKIAKGDGTIIASEPDNSEYGFTDPWLIYKPNNFFKFKSSNGGLVSLDTIESEQILARFEKAFTILNALENSERMTPESRVAGENRLLNQRPIDFNTTGLGYGGTQNRTIVSCEYGHIWVDAERGQVFLLPPGGNGLQEISKSAGNQPTNMKRWFKEHLPFKIKKNNQIGNPEDIDTDNAYKGIGIAMGWDSKYERLFLTKRDYKLIDKNIELCYRDGKFYNVSDEIITPLVSQYEGEGWTYESIEKCRIKFIKEGVLPSTTNIYTFFDVTSMGIGDVEAASGALTDWFTSYQEDNPSFDGNLYILPILTEAYLTLHILLRRGSSSLVGNNPDRPGDNYMAFAILPPNFSLGNDDPNPLWTPEDSAVQLCFVDEVQPDYHNSIPNDFLGQPTNKFKDDYLMYKVGLQEFTFLKNILYPIPKGGPTDNLVLQGIAAIEGKILTPTELAEFDPQVDVTAILSENPYFNAVMPDSSIYTPLNALGWKGVYNKKSPASSVFTSETFGQELTNIIRAGSSGEQEALFVDLPEVLLTDTNYFKDVSWTISFNFQTGKWASYFDFKPNYYLAQNNYFQSGVNYSTNDDSSEEGLWSHLLTNRSFQVFYGKAYDWEIEVPIQNKGSKRFLEYTSYIMESLRYHNDYDYSETQEVGFDEMYIYNNTNISGNLVLDKQKSLSQISKYPITEGNQQRILQVNDEGVWNVNYFYNRTKDQNNNVPLFTYDENEIQKHINQQAVSFYGKRTLERLRGMEFLINFKSKDTRHKKMFRLGFTKENLYLE